MYTSTLGYLSTELGYECSETDPRPFNYQYLLWYPKNHVYIRRKYCGHMTGTYHKWRQFPVTTSKNCAASRVCHTNASCLVAFRQAAGDPQIGLSAWP